MAIGVLWRAARLFERIVKKTFIMRWTPEDLAKGSCWTRSRIYTIGASCTATSFSENLLLKSPFNDFDIKLADSASRACRRLFQSRPRHRASVAGRHARKRFLPPVAGGATHDDAAATTAPPRHRARVAAREGLAAEARRRHAPPTQAKKVEGKSLDTQCGTPGYVLRRLKGAGTARRWTCGAAVIAARLARRVLSPIS